MVLLSIGGGGGSSMSVAGKENTPVPGCGSDSAPQSNREDQYMGGAKDVSQSQSSSTGEQTSVVSYAPSAERSSVLSNKVTSLLKEKYAGGRREECEDRVDVDSVNSDNEGMPNGMHDMENLSLYHSPPPGNMNPSLTDAASLHEFALQRHRLGLMSDMRNKALSPETSELLRGILQGKEKRLQEHLSPHGNGGDGALMSKLLQHSEGDQHLLHNGSFDGEEDSLPSGSPGNMSLEESDLENTNSQDVMNGSHTDCELSPGGENKRKMDDSSSTGSVGDSQEAKRARVENIITMMQSPTRPASEGNNSSMEQRRPKRKQYIPQQHDVYSSDHPSPKVRKMEQEVIKKQLKFMQDQLSEMQQRYSQIFDFEASDPSDLTDLGQTNENRRPNYVDCERVENNKDIIKKPGFGMGDNRTGECDPSHFIKQANKLVKEQEFAAKNSNHPAPTDIKNLAKTLKAEITNSVGSLVDSIVAKYLEQQKSNLGKQTVINLADSVKEKLSKTPPPAPEEDKLPRQNSPKPVRSKVTDKISHPLLDLHKNMPEMPRMHPAMQHLFAPPPYFPVAHLHSLYGAPKEPEQAEPLSLVVNTPKKKRTKVTDTRLSPRAARALLQESLSQHGESEKMPMTPHHHSLPHHMHHNPHHHHGHQDGFHPPLVPVTLPTSVAIPNPSLQHSEVLAMYSHPGAEHKSYESSRNSSYSPNVGDHGSPNMAHTPNEGLSMAMMKLEDVYEHQHNMMMGETHTFDGTPITTTLTPMHLRKAKLMFFYTRYPSSAILKIYFPDVKFNKNNTAQLVKWFSNFREFFYIQMEKYARQALAEGVKNSEDLIVTLDHELYRVLNLHYNRNNQIEVPDHFRLVVQSTLREFYKAVQANKDTEQSWKKSIYKVIARMDDTIPEYFKSPNWMEQLSDM